MTTVNVNEDKYSVTVTEGATTVVTVIVASANFVVLLSFHI